MKAIKKANVRILAASLLVSGLTFFAAPAEANVKSGMKVMWNHTSASAGGINGNLGGTLGGFSARVPNRSFHVFAYDAPRIQAGCGGIDIYLGSFSMISGANLTGLMRAIVSNAAGYAFKMALDAICPKCQSVMSGLQDALSKIGAGNMNTCQMASAAVDSIRNGTVLADSKNAAQSYFDGIKNSAKGVRQDFIAAFDATSKQGKNANRPADAHNESTNYGNTLINTLITGRVITPGMTGGSQPWNIFGNPKGFAEIAMSLYGTNVVLTGSEANAHGSPQNTKDDKVLPPMWSFHNFIYGNKTGEGRMQMYTCTDFKADNAGSCQKTTNRASDWYGMKRYTVEMLAGKQDGYGDSKGDDLITEIKPESIMGMLLDNSNAEKLTDEQRRFRNHISGDMLEALSGAARCGERTAAAVAETAADFIANQMGSEIILKLNHEIRAAYGLNTARDSSGKAKAVAALTEQQREAMLKLERDALNVSSTEAKAKQAKIIREAVCVTKQRAHIAE